MTRNQQLSPAIAVAMSGVLILAVAGCGAGTEKGGSEQSGSGAAPACDVDKPQSDTTINILAYTSPSLDPFTNAMVACSGGNLKVQHAGVDFNGQLTKADLSLPSQTASYDVTEVYTSSLIQYASKGWIVPLDDYVAKYKAKYHLEDLDPKQLEQFTYKGKLYALPSQVSVHEMVFRKDILDKLGIAPPKNFDELIAAAQKIKAANVVKYPLAVPISASTYAGSDFNNSLTSLGSHLVDEKTNKVQVSTPQGVTALDSLRKLLPYMSPDAVNMDEATAVTAMQNGQSAMAIMYSGNMGQLTDPNMSQNAANFAFAPPPPVADGGTPWATMFIDGFAIAKNSKVSPDLLFQVAANGTSAAAAKAAGAQAYPSRLSVINGQGAGTGATAYWPGVTETLMQGATGPVPVPYFGGLVSAIKPSIAKALFQGAATQDALQEAQQAGSTFVSQNANK